YWMVGAASRIGGKALGYVTGPGRLYVELVVAGVLLAAIGGQTWRLHSSQTDAAVARAALAEFKAPPKPPAAPPSTRLASKNPAALRLKPRSPMKPTPIA